MTTKKTTEDLLVLIANHSSEPVDTISSQAFQIAGAFLFFGCCVASVFVGPVPILCFIGFCLYAIAVILIRFPRDSAIEQAERISRTSTKS